jgi:hypothetical protein
MTANADVAAWEDYVRDSIKNDATLPETKRQAVTQARRTLAVIAPPEMTSALRGVRPKERDAPADYISRQGDSSGQKAILHSDLHLAEKALRAGQRAARSLSVLAIQDVRMGADSRLRRSQNNSAPRPRFSTPC